MAAMHGVLLIGWSTAVIYDVPRTFVHVAPDQKNVVPTLR
jgi:hypothetical protein